MKTKFIYWLCLLLSTFSLLIPAFINGYPIVYSDTSTYLSAGFGLMPPFDRPMTYGVFILLTSLNGFTLWLVAAVQSLILAWLIFRLIKAVFGSERYYTVYALVTVVVLSLLSSISWTSSQLMPDIFTPIMVLSAVLLLLFNLKKGEKVFLYFMYFFSTAMHMGHISYGIAFLAIVLVLRYFNVLQLKQKVKVQTLIVLFVLTIASIGTMSAAYAKSKHVFFMGVMVEHGIAKKYLDEYCGEKTYALCKYKDELPKYAWEFIWEKWSPLYQIGWGESKQEFNEIIRGTLTKPKYIALHIKESVNATMVQLVKFKIGEGNGDYPKGTKLYERVEKNIPREINCYEQSKQNQQGLNYKTWFNKLQTIIYIVSLVIILFAISKIKGELLMVYLLLFGAIVLNAWVNGTFANAIDRLGCKISWFVPFMAVVSIIYLRASQKNSI